MEVLLLKDVEQLGKEGVVVKVKPGFARNYLVPRGLAMAATKQNMRQIEERRRQAGVKAQRLRKQADEQKTNLEKAAIVLSLSVGENDTPFGSVTIHDILQALAQEGFTLEKSQIQLDEPIKALGTFDVPVKVHADVIATLKVRVVKAS